MGTPPVRNPQHRRSLRLRLLVGTLAWIFGSLALAGWGLAELFRQHVERQFQAELHTHLDQLIAALNLGETPLRLVGSLSDPRFTRPYSGLYWQVDRMPSGAAAESGHLRARALWDATLTVPADTPADGQLHVHRIAGPRGEPLYMIERLIRPDPSGGQAWRLIVAADEALLAEPVARFSGALWVALALLGSGLVVAAVVQVWLGLRPLAELRAALVRVREGQAGTMEGRFPDEVQPLVDEFNAALATNAEIVARARTQAGNLAHALKTPLAVLANAAEAEQGPFAELVREQLAVARTQVDHHLARARAAAAVRTPGLRTPLQSSLQGVLRVMNHVHAERGLSLHLGHCPSGAEVRAEAQDLQEMLGNLLDNACKWARHRVDVEIEEGGRAPFGEQPEQRGAPARQWLIRITDDGPGLPATALEAVLERGVRADERTPGSGLGLAIVRDLASAYGGSIRLDQAPGGGLCAELRLPAA
ncbi:MAG: HAMP domain-containing sensor histidine kinase [Rhodocyclaceae bacterium]